MSALIVERQSQYRSVSPRRNPNRKDSRTIQMDCLGACEEAWPVYGSDGKEALQRNISINSHLWLFGALFASPSRSNCPRECP